MFHQHITSDWASDKILKYFKPQTLYITSYIDADEDHFLRRVCETINLAKLNGQQILPVVINSRGGELHLAMAVIDALRTSKLKIITIATGLVASAASLIFSVGEERYITPTSRIMLHDASADINDHLSGPAMENEAKEMRRVNQFLYDVISCNIGKPRKYFYDMVRKNGHAVDCYLNAKDALFHGFATHIGFPEITHSLKVESSVTEAKHEYSDKYLSWIKRDLKQDSKRKDKSSNESADENESESESEQEPEDKKETPKKRKRPTRKLKLQKAKKRKHSTKEKELESELEQEKQDKNSNSSSSSDSDSDSDSEKSSSE